jgi:hypothetical protein
MIEPKKYRLEKNLKADVKKLLKEAGAKYFMPVPTGFSEGAVDFLVCYLGAFLAIETKIAPRKPTPLQEQFLNEITEAGGYAVVAYGLEDVKTALYSIEQGMR